MTMPRRPTLFAAALLLTSATSCSLFSSRQELRTLEIVFDNPKTALPYSVEIVVGTRGPDGKEHRATGTASQGALLTALCRSLRGSLEYDGCQATYRDLDAPAEDETPDQRLRRSMRQVVELPEGWTFVFARTKRTIQHENIADSGGSGHIIFTMRGDA